MCEQIIMEEVFGYNDNSPFEANDENNEQEEDVLNTGFSDIGEMAISGTDWTAETIVRQIEKGNIVLDPDFQRRDAWSVQKKSRFIESLILGFPIPQIILAEKKGKKGKFVVIDGKQRLLSLLQFMSDIKFSGRILKLRGLQVKAELNGKTFQNMCDEGLVSDIDALSNQPIRTVVVKNWPSSEVLYLIFLRLNTGSVKLSPQELRQALYPGEFTRFANIAASESDAIKKILKLQDNKPDFRMRDVEIFIRYMAFQYYASHYSGSMQRFLDSACKQLNDSWATSSNEIKSKGNNLELASEYTRKIFGNNAFCKYKQGKYESKTNRALMDIMLYYFSDKEVREKSEGKEEKIRNLFERLCMEDERFLDSIEQTTKSITAVKYRFRTWAQVLSSCISILVVSPFGE